MVVNNALKGLETAANKRNFGNLFAAAFRFPGAGSLFVVKAVAIAHRSQET